MAGSPQLDELEAATFADLAENELVAALKVVSPNADTEKASRVELLELLKVSDADELGAPNKVNKAQCVAVVKAVAQRFGGVYEGAYYKHSSKEKCLKTVAWWIGHAADHTNNRVRSLRSGDGGVSDGDGDGSKEAAPKRFRAAAVAVSAAGCAAAMPMGLEVEYAKQHGSAVIAPPTEEQLEWAKGTQLFAQLEVFPPAARLSAGEKSCVAMLLSRNGVASLLGAGAKDAMIRGWPDCALGLLEAAQEVYKLACGAGAETSAKLRLRALMQGAEKTLGKVFGALDEAALAKVASLVGKPNSTMGGAALSKAAADENQWRSLDLAARAAVAVGLVKPVHMVELADLLVVVARALTPAQAMAGLDTLVEEFLTGLTPAAGKPDFIERVRSDLQRAAHSAHSKKPEKPQSSAAGTNAAGAGAAAGSAGGGGRQGAGSQQQKGAGRGGRGGRGGKARNAPYYNDWGYQYSAPGKGQPSGQYNDWNQWSQWGPQWGPPGGQGASSDKGGKKGDAGKKGDKKGE